MKQSAGILLYRKTGKNAEVLLVHPGGPFWAKKDEHAWSIPKGEYTEDEEPLTAAKREFKEELGSPAPNGTAIDLGIAKQSNKIVHAWAIEGDFDVTMIKSNLTEIDWPPRSGQKLTVPEVDKAAWCTVSKARRKLIKGQLTLLDTWVELCNISDSIKEDKDDVAQTSLF